MGFFLNLQLANRKLKVELGSLPIITEFLQTLEVGDLGFPNISLAMLIHFL